uniref:Putative hydroxypyruvate reductase/glycerate kinase n=1 Tax=Leptospirillum ferrodiazotrophum TaxID=412449 RepID=C6HY74_9BACT|nr:MAG: putative hydroxypyruvate reductase/glycerate kinase [Leptospirillum ferrodiazotrophum]
MEEDRLRRRILEKIPEFMADIAPGNLLRSHLKDHPLPDSFLPGAILSMGKAAGFLTEALAEFFSLSSAQTLSILPEGYPRPPLNFPFFEGAHPLPDRRSLEAFERIRNFINGIPPSSPMVIALSGGSSSLIASPVPPVTLEEKTLVSRQLIEAGAPIETLNSLRLHLSQFKGGGLARIISPRPHVTFVLSDIPGTGVSLVGSAPMTPIHRNGPRLLEELRLFIPLEKIPSSVRNTLLGQSQDPFLADPPSDSPLWVIGSSRSLIRSMKVHFATIPEISGLPLHLLTDELCGESREAGRVLASLIAWQASSSPSIHTGGIWAASGETTVTLTGGPTGKGGRTLELALSLAISLFPLPALVLSLASDGFDGNSGLAGALVPTSFFSSPQRRIEGQLALRHHDSGHFLEENGFGIRTGPSGTNVNDLLLVIVYPNLA